MPVDLCWYLLRTKPNRERYVKQQLMRLVPEVFLPLLSSKGWSSGGQPGTVPLFPQYLFVRVVRDDLANHYFSIRYAPGVVSFVTAGLEPLPVPEDIIESIRSRSTNGVVRVVPKPFRQGEGVRIMNGPFRGFDAVFERYLSGPDRVAILLNAVEGRSVRLIARAENLAR